METTKSYWFCSSCKQSVPSYSVTFEELHDRCGHSVELITDESIPAEAIDVHQKTSLTPRQLLEQRDEAMEVLKFAKNALNKFQRSYGTYECEAYLRIEKLIQKTNPTVKQQS